MNKLPDWSVRATFQRMDGGDLKVSLLAIRHEGKQTCARSAWRLAADWTEAKAIASRFALTHGQGHYSVHDMTGELQRDSPPAPAKPAREPIWRRAPGPSGKPLYPAQTGPRSV